MTIRPFVRACLPAILAGIAVAFGAAGYAATDPFPSTYRPATSTPTVIRNATVLDGTGRRHDGADVLMRDGRIVAVGAGIEPSGAGLVVVDAAGRWVTPGIIDVHSHLGVGASPGVNAHQDTNEATDPVTAGVWAEHGVWPQDPGFTTARAGGVTTLQILPGSANLIGGRGVTLRNVPATTYQAMKFPGAPQGLKMACGENPKRVYGDRDKAPSTRMGNVAGYRQAFADAQDYKRQNEKYERDLADYERKTSDRRKSKDSDAEMPVPPKRDLRLETLVAAMDGDIRVHVHCYRSDEMAVMLDLAREFGFEIAAFHHGVEAYKLADRLAEAGVCGALWADWGASRWKRTTRSGRTSNSSTARRTAARSCTPIPRRAFSDSTRKRPRRWHAASAPGSTSRPSARSAGSPRILPARSASPIASARSSPGGSPMSCCGTATRSASTRRRTRSTSTGHWSTTAARRHGCLIRTSCSASRWEVADERAQRPATRLPRAASRPRAAARGRPRAELLIRGATVHTLTERGTLERADVRVRGGRIAEVGTGLAAEPDFQVIEAQGRPLTPGLFGGITGLGIEEIELEPATVDASVLVEDASPTQEFAAWPEFDVTVAYNPDSAAIGVNRVEGITYAMVAPRGAILAGQGSVARLDGRADTFPAASRTLWSDLGADATEDGGRNRAAQFMLLEQAVREARPGATMRDADFRVLTPTGREVLARYLAGGRIAFAVDRAADIRQVLRFAKRVGARAVIVGGAQAWQVAGELARARVPVILDPLWTCPRASTTSARRSKTPRACNAPACRSRSRTSSPPPTTRTRCGRQPAWRSQMACPGMRRSRR